MIVLIFRSDRQGLTRMHPGVRLGIHFVHHIRGQRTLSSGKAENHQRRRHPGRYGGAGIRELPGTVDGVFAQISRNDQIGTPSVEQQRCGKWRRQHHTWIRGGCFGSRFRVYANRWILVKGAWLAWICLKNCTFYMQISFFFKLQ